MRPEPLAHPILQFGKRAAARLESMQNHKWCDHLCSQRIGNSAGPILYPALPITSAGARLLRHGGLRSEEIS